MNIRNWLAAMAAGLMLVACAAPKAGDAPAGQAAADAPVVKEAYDPALNSNPVACKAKNGEIQRVCRMQSEMCVISFKDAGKSCTDSAQCGGRCIAKETGFPSNQPATGVCTANSDPCGCFQLIEKGVAQPTLCAD